MFRAIVGVVLATVLVTVFAERTCSIGRKGTLTMFNGDRYERNVVLPCKYQLAEFHCGDFKIQVTPGSKMEDSGDFTPDTVYVRVDNLSSNEHWRGRTANGLIKKNKASGEVWKTQDGQLSDIQRLYDEARAAAVISFAQTFEIVFRNLDDNGDDAGVTVTCFSDDDFHNSSRYPDSLCGDDAALSVLTHRRAVYGADGDSSFRQIISYDILNQNVLQSRECSQLAETFQESCPGDQALAIQTCHGLAERPNTAACLARVDGTIADNYLDCLNYICNGDSSACSRLRDDVTNGRNGCPGKTSEFFPFINNC